MKKSLFLFAIASILALSISCTNPSATDDDDESKKSEQGTYNEQNQNPDEKQEEEDDDSELDYFNVILPGTNEFEGLRIAILGDSISTHIYEDGQPANIPELTVTKEDVIAGTWLTAYVKFCDVYNVLDIPGQINKRKELNLGGKTYDYRYIGKKIYFKPTIEDIGKTVGTPRTYYTKDGVVSTYDRKGYIKKWWMYLKESYKLEVIPVCYSGSRISGQVALDKKASLVASEAYHDSQIASCGVRIPGTRNRLPPDVVIIQRMANDYNNKIPITKDFFATHEYTKVDSGLNDEGKDGFVESYVYTINKLRAAYPDVKIICCTLFSLTNNPSIREYNAAVTEIAEETGCGLIDFGQLQLASKHFWKEGHPKAKGQYFLGIKAWADFKSEMRRLNGEPDPESELE